MEPNTPVQRKVIKISRRKLGVAIIALVLLVIICLAATDMARQAKFGRSSGSLTPNSLPTVSAPGMSGRPSPESGVDISYYPGYNNQPNISDTREFLKTDYSANIKTRDVRDAARDAKASVREVNGRIDSENLSEKSAYISFVVPKSRFQEFRDEIETITHAKLFTENVSTQNLLGQKQNIEQQMQSATATLASLQKQKKDLDTKHANAVAAINRELASLKTQLTDVREDQQSTQDQNRLAALSAQEAALVQREAVLRQSLSNENSSYSNQSQNLSSQITYTNQRIQNVQEQDTQFMDNIETVNGRISFEWVSLWDMWTKVSPIHPVIILIIIVIAGWYILYRAGFIPKIELA